MNDQLPDLITRPDANVRDRRRRHCQAGTTAPVAAAQVVAPDAATVAAANDHWRAAR